MSSVDEIWDMYIKKFSEYDNITLQNMKIEIPRSTNKQITDAIHVMLATKAIQYILKERGLVYNGE